MNDQDLVNLFNELENMGTLDVPLQEIAKGMVEYIVPRTSDDTTIVLAEI